MIERDGPSPLTLQLRKGLPKFIRDVQDDPRGSGPDLVLGRAAIKDYSNSRVLDRLMMYERRIENSMFKTLNELERLRLLRELEQADTAEEQFDPEPCPPTEKEVDLKKQRQSPAFGRKLEALSTKSETEAFEKTKPICEDRKSVSAFAREHYENKYRRGSRENKPKQSQTPAFGRKSSTGCLMAETMTPIKGAGKRKKIVSGS